MPSSRGSDPLKPGKTGSAPAYRAQDHWRTEDREALTSATLGVFEMLPARDELVRRITTSYVPASAHRAAVDGLRQYGGHLDTCSMPTGAPDCDCGFDAAMLRALGRSGGW